MPILAFAIPRLCGADLSACQSHNVHALKVTWLMRLARLIRLKTAPIAFVKSAEFPIASRKFARHAVKDCAELHRKPALADATSVHPTPSCAQQVANAFRKPTGAMVFKTALMMKPVAL